MMRRDHLSKSTTHTEEQRVERSEDGRITEGWDGVVIVIGPPSKEHCAGKRVL